MPIYTVHEPPAKNGRAADPQRFAFVRDGFHFWAFLLGPVWMIYRRLWLTLAGYLLVAALLEVAFFLLRAPEGARFVIGLLVGVLIGLEASTLRRWTYARNKWKTIGLAGGESEEEAERRFFAEWVNRPAAEEIVRDRTVPPMAPLVRRDPGAGGEIIGLFPQPERRP